MTSDRTDVVRFEVSEMNGKLTKLGRCTCGGLDTMMMACIAALAVYDTAPFRKTLESHPSRKVANLRRKRKQQRNLGVGT